MGIPHEAGASRDGSEAGASRDESEAGASCDESEAEASCDDGASRDIHIANQATTWLSMTLK